jgi:hypothetical protein
MADLRIDLAAEFKGKKAFKEADKATGSLDKAVNALGKKLVAAFAVEKILQFGVTAVKAFTEDEAAASKLAKTVDNLGLGFANPAIAKYIDELTLATGVADSQLRPALQSLISTTGAVTYSQELLSQAIDISRGSGVELSTVVSDLTAAYTGQTKGIAKYKTGLSKAQLASMSFSDIMTKLNGQFTGSNSAYLQTYAGKIGLIKNAAGEATEAIGKGLVDAFSILAGGANGDISSITTSMINLATSIGDIFRGAAYYIKEFLNNPIVSKLIQVAMWFWNKIGKKLVMLSNPILNLAFKASEKGKTLRGKEPSTGMTAAQLAIIAEKDRLARLKADKAAAAAAKQKAAQDKALKKAGTIFDLEQIQIVAALKGQVSAEDRKRLEAQAAILNGNADLAMTLTKQILMAQDSSGKLYQYFLSIGDATIKNPFSFLDQWIIEFQKKLDGLKAPILTTITTSAGTTAIAPVSGAVQGFTPSVQYPTPSVSAGDAGFIGPVAPQPVINVTVQGNIIKEQELINQVLAGAQLSSLSGSPSQIGRIAGMFG